MPLRYLLTAALIVTMLVYWTGLSGPFIFDDDANLAQIMRWLDGRATLFEAIFGTGSGLFHRPIPMATLALNAYYGGTSPVLFKLTNLLLHLTCGILVWQLIRKLLARDIHLHPHAAIIAGLVAAIWLLHPLNASTVLYVVQRMAQLGCIFVLLAAWSYVEGRLALESGRHRTALVCLFLAFPTCALAGLLSKENAAVVILLCAVIEIGYFSKGALPKQVRLFYATFLIAPGAAALIYVSLYPDAIFRGYEMRDFTLGERILTQGPVLADYVRQIVFPDARRMGLYSDDFPISTALLSPAGTLASWTFLLVVSAAACAVRRRAPSVFTGWFFFLAAHSVESTVLPLEIYFEHRNYLPAIGLLLAIVGGAWHLISFLHLRARNAQLLGSFLGLAILALLALLTFNRAVVWKTKEGIAQAGVEYHPASLRANLDYATVGLHTGRYDMSMDAMQRLTNSSESRHRFIGRLGMISVDCIRSGKGSLADISRALADAQPRVALSDYQAMGLLARVVAEVPCGDVTDDKVASSMVYVLDKAVAQPDESEPKWRMRMIAAQQLARANRLPEALTQARLAWQPKADVGVGSTLVQIHAALGDIEAAESTLREMEGRLGKFEQLGFAEIQRLREQLSTRERKPEG